MTLHYLTFLEFFFQLCFNDSNRGRVGGGNDRGWSIRLCTITYYWMCMNPWNIESSKSLGAENVNHVPKHIVNSGIQHSMTFMLL